MAIFDRRSVTPHQHTEALKHLVTRREKLIKALARGDNKLTEHAEALYYVDHAISSLNDGQGQSMERYVDG